MELLFRNNPLAARPIVNVPDEIRSNYVGNALEDNEFQKAMLIGLQGKPTYTGTVPTAVIEKRRARNKSARKSRRINRQH